MNQSKSNIANGGMHRGGRVMMGKGRSRKMQEEENMKKKGLKKGTKKGLKKKGRM